MSRIPLSVRRRWERATAWARSRRELAHPECGAVGCAACCRSDVVSDRREAAAIFPLLTPAQLADLRGRAPAPAPVPSDDPSYSARALAHLDRYGAPCVFLTPDRRCSIYAQRPALCRTFMVGTPPANCENTSTEQWAAVIDDGLIGIIPGPDSPETGMLIDLLQELDRDRS